MKIQMLLVTILLISSGCTIVPKQPVSYSPSFDGNTQDSGFKGYTSDGYGIISQSKLDEYNALTQSFGQRFVPPLKENAGVIRRSDQILIDKEHIVKFEQMLDMARKEVK